LDLPALTFLFVAALFDCPPLVELEVFIGSKFRRVFPVTERGGFLLVQWHGGFKPLLS
jgi:hypothetical protein